MFLFLLDIALTPEQPVGDCEFITNTKPAQFIKNCAEPAFKLITIGGINKKLGIETVNSTFPSEAFSSEFNASALQTYVISIAGFTVLILILVIIEIIFFCCSQCWACCCCTPKKTKKFQWMWAIVHLCFIAVMLIAIIIFFVAGGNFSAGASNLAKIGSKFSFFIDNTVSKVTGFINLAIGLINGLLNSAIAAFRLFVSTITKIIDEVKTSVETAVTKSQDAHQFSTNGLKTKADSINQKFKTCSASDKTLIDNSKISDTLEGVKDAMQSFKEKIENIKEIKTKIETSINQAEGDVKKQVNNFNNSLQSSINSIDFNSFKDAVNDIDSKYMQPAKKYINLVIYIAVAVLAGIVVTYAVIYFFSGCCCRCLATFFPAWGLLFAILFGIPSIAFSIIVVLFGDMCPHIETIADSFTANMFENASISAALYCNGTDKSLYNLLGLENQFNVRKYLDDFKDQINGKLTPVNASDILDALNKSTSLNESSFTLDGLKEAIGLKSKILEIVDHFPTCKVDTQLHTDINDYFDNMLDKQLSDKLNAMMDSVTKSIAYSREIAPAMLNATNFTQHLVSDFIVEFNGTINNFLTNDLTCQDLCAVYSPIKNALCANVVNGGAFWLISCCIMIIGSICVMFSICKRRKDMKAVQVEDGSDYSESSSSTSSSNKRNE